MRHFLASLLLLAAPAMASDMVMHLKSPGSEVRLYESPCAVPDLLEQVKAEYRDQFKAARAKVNGKAIAGCWIEDGDTALMLFENGERLGVPLSEFSDPNV